jgi:2-aminoadipate transaminase
MRLNFSGVDEDTIREGVRRIGEVAHEQLDLLRTIAGPPLADVLPLPVRDAPGRGTTPGVADDAG